MVLDAYVLNVKIWGFTMIVDTISWLSEYKKSLKE